MAADGAAPEPEPATLRAGFLLFPQLTQLDLTGPLEVLSKLPGSEVRTCWKQTGTHL